MKLNIISATYPPPCDPCSTCDGEPEKCREAFPYCLYEPETDTCKERYTDAGKFALLHNQFIELWFSQNPPYVIPVLNATMILKDVFMPSLTASTTQQLIRARIDTQV